MGKLSNQNVPLVTADLIGANGNFSFEAAQEQASKYLGKPGADSQPRRQAACGEVVELSTVTFPTQQLRLVGGSSQSSSTTSSSSNDGPLATVGGVGGGGYARGASHLRVAPIPPIAAIKIQYKSTAERVAEVRALHERKHRQAREDLQKFAGPLTAELNKLTASDIQLLNSAASVVDSLSSSERIGSIRHTVDYLAHALVEYRTNEHSISGQLLPGTQRYGVSVALERIGRDGDGPERWNLKLDVPKQSLGVDTFAPSEALHPTLGFETEKILTSAAILKRSREWMGEPGNLSDSISGMIDVPKQSWLGKTLGL